MKVYFTQFVRPFGKRRSIWIEIDNPDSIIRADYLIKKGLKFEIEILTTGEVSAEIRSHSSDGEDTTEASFIRQNGPGMKEAVEKLIDEAYEHCHNT